MKNTLKIKGKKLKLTTLGFTLIELLAVIVILAIIALIAIPIVIHIINDTKNSSEKESIKLYLDTLTKTIGTISQPLKARLPKMSEINGAGCVGINGTCPVWLMENITYFNVSNDKYAMNNNSEAYQDSILGYWLLSSRSGNFQAHFIWYPGRWFYFYTTRPGYGVRPVITVPITDLLN